MSLISEQFKKSKAIFEQTRAEEDGSQVMQKIVNLINELGTNFSKLDGGALAEIQMKLAGYKFYIADYTAELEQASEALKLDIKEEWAKSWDIITEEIKAEQGKVSNKQQIENVLIINTRNVANEQILYETCFHKYRLRISAISDILTTLTQRIAELKKQIEQSKSV